VASGSRSSNTKVSQFPLTNASSMLQLTTQKPQPPALHIAPKMQSSSVQHGIHTAKIGCVATLLDSQTARGYVG